MTRPHLPKQNPHMWFKTDLPPKKTLNCSLRTNFRPQTNRKWLVTASCERTPPNEPFNENQPFPAP